MKKIALLASLFPLLASPLAEELDGSYSSKRPARTFSGKKHTIHPKGVKRFEINGKIVYAINRKNAVRKASKI